LTPELKDPGSNTCPARGGTKADVDHPAILAQRLRPVGGDPHKIRGREGGSLEFKESFNWGGREAYSKTLAAFANNAGGYIIFGVKNKPREVVGLQGGAFEDRDDATITAYFNENFSPEIAYDRGHLDLCGKRLGFIYVAEASRKPVMCTRNGSDLKEGDIYYRYRARSERIHYPELAEIVRKIEETIQRKWTQLLARITRVGAMDAQVLSTRDATRSSAATVVSATLDPLAPRVQLAESEFRRNFPLDYKALLESLRESCDGFKAGRVFNDLMKELKLDPAFCHIRLLDPDNPNGTKKNYYTAATVSEICRGYRAAKGLG